MPGLDDLFSERHSVSLQLFLCRQAFFTFTQSSLEVTCLLSSLSKYFFFECVSFLNQHLFPYVAVYNMPMTYMYMYMYMIYTYGYVFSV